MLCSSQPLLPVGLTDIPYEKSVKLFCGRCEDLYSPKSSRHGSIDGAYFGTTFPHLLFLVYPTLIPSKDGEVAGGGGGGAGGAGGNAAGGAAGADARSRRRLREEPDAAAVAAAAAVATEGGGEGIKTANAAIKAERYRPRIYGFQLNETAKLQRWQEAIRDR